MSENKAFIHRFTTEQFTKEALQAQDGKKIPLMLQPGGEVIGEAVLRYIPGDEELEAYFEVEDPEIVAQIIANKELQS